VPLFKPYESQSDQPSPEPVKNSAKKQVPTPTRKQAEQARRDRLQPVLTKKQANAKNRDAKYKVQNEQLAKTHARPVNAMIRDWVDHRWNLSEFIMPGMLLLLLLIIAAGYIWPQLGAILPIVMYAVVIVWVADTAVMMLGMRKQVRTYFPEETMKGKWGYAWSRASMFRRARQPAPRVKRGSKFVWPYPGDK